MEMLDSLCIYAMILAGKTKEKVREFFASQDGVSNVVATIILLTIVVTLIAFFWKHLQTWINGMTDKIFSENFTNHTLTDPKIPGK